ncbi:MAG: DUF1579 domain-containing protein [Gammaproteobacteria bacterium]|nr:DUF1579 domain-containing protein [Gammaproteobacteria bacterium]
MTEQPEQIQQMGPRTSEHDKLNPFEGTFSTVVKLWMGPGEPMTSTGTMVNDWVLGGRYLRQAFTGDPVDGPYQPFEGIGFWGYSGTSKKYQGYWIDNASTWMQLETGSVDASGKIWTMKSRFPNPADGKPMNKRSVITLHDNDHHLMESFFTVEGGEEVKSMEISYTRKS